MADAPGKDPSSDQKAVGKTGPVKPPVLEGTARPADMGKPDSAKADAAKPAAAKSDPATILKSTDKPEPPKQRPPTPAPKKDEDEGSGSAWLAGVLGGVIGLGAAYGLAFFGLWPATQQAEAQADPRLAQFATAIPELQTVTGTMQDELSTLNGRVSGLETSLADLPSEPAAPGEDFSAQIEALGARLDELAAAPTPETDTSALDALRTEVATLTQQLTESRAQIDETEANLAALSESTTAASESDSAVVRLPLVFSALESAFASGRAYDTELAALQAAAPDAAIPADVAGKAATGLPRPDDVARRLDAALPDMLASRPVAADAGWQDATADWFRGLVAMRPAGDVEGSGPDATIARLEAAVERRDFAAAQTEFTALPDAMRSAAGSLGDDIASLAAAATLLDDLRSAALSNEADI